MRAPRFVRGLCFQTLSASALGVLLSCASVSEDGPGEAGQDEAERADERGTAAPAGSTKAQAPAAATPTLSSADARAAYPNSGGIDPARWLSARDKSLTVPSANVKTLYDNVVYQPAALVFDVDSVAAYQSHDASKGEYRFDAAKLKAAGLSLDKGATFMIPGLALRKVTGVRSEGGALIAVTEQGALNDVIKDGTVGFEAKLSLDPQHVIGWLNEAGVSLPVHRELPLPNEPSPPSMLAMAMPMPILQGSAGSQTRFPELSAAPANPDAFNPEHTKWSYSKAGISYQLEIDARGDDAKVLIKAIKEGGGDSEFQYWAKGTFKSVYLNAKGEYKDGEVKSLTYSQPDMIGDMEISIAAAGKGQGKKEINFTLPEAMLRYVFPVGSIPIVVEVSAKMIGRVEVPSKGSATATAKFKWSGQAGLEYKGTDVKAEGIFHSVDIKPDPFDSASMIGNSVDAQWGVAIPRVSAGAFGTFFVPYIQPGITVGSHLKWGPLCKSGYVRFNVIAGWDFGVMGVSLAQDKQELYKSEQRAPKGGCK